MKPEDQLTLSFYKEISTLGKSDNITLVKKIDTNEVFVKKVYVNCDPDVFNILKQNRFAGVPKIYECIYDPDAETTTIIEEHINGKGLDSILEHVKRIPDDSAIAIVESLCDILRPLHGNDPPIIHRDIKPSNIIIKDDGTVTLIDFDASRLFVKGMKRDTELLGTESYAAPEQYGFLQSDPRTDVYALGVLMREMITGSPEPNDPTGPLAPIISKCTCIDPANRYSDVTELKHTLVRISNLYGPKGDYSGYAIPGFRNSSLSTKIIAVLLYLLAVYSCLTYEDPNMSIPVLWVNRICIFFVIISYVLLFGNYLDIQKKLPLTRSPNKVIRVFGFILYCYIILFVLALISAAAEKIASFL